MKRCQFLILAYFIIGALSLQAQPSASDIILLQEDWESAIANTVPAGWSGDIDEAMTLDTGWVVGMGPSSTALTGPNGANTGSKYMYFESGSPAGPGAMAELISPIINISGTNPTLNFALYMYGGDIQMLDVSVVQGVTKSLLQRYNTQLQTSKTEPWRIENLDLSAYSGQAIQLSFEAQKMALAAGDIAIDTIFVYSGPNVTAIPTLSQWGLIILILLLLIVMIRAYGSRVVRSITVRS